MKASITNCKGAITRLVGTFVFVMLVQSGLAQATYSITDLGTLGGNNTIPLWITNTANVIGLSDTGQFDIFGNPIDHAFRWRKGGMQDLGTLGDVNSVGLGGDDKGAVVGNNWYNLFTSAVAASTVSAQALRLASAASSANRDGKKPRSPKLAVVVYDFAHLDPSVVLSAKKVATEIFKDGGIETEWFDCSGSLACDLHTQGAQFRLLIHSGIENVARDHSVAKGLAETHTLGFAMPCNTSDSTCLFYVFYSPISSLASQYGASAGCILGHVMVHEIGHALLGPDPHSRAGIMQPRFPIQGMDRFLNFSARESKRARNQLLLRNEVVRSRIAGLSAPVSLQVSK